MLVISRDGMNVVTFGEGCAISVCCSDEDLLEEAGMDVEDVDEFEIVVFTPSGDFTMEVFTGSNALAEALEVLRDFIEALHKKEESFMF